GAWIEDAAIVRAIPAGSVLAPIRRLGGDVSCLHLADPRLVTAADLDRFMRSTSLVCDTSFPADDGAAPDGAVNRNAAYHGTAPYQPQPFDVSSPWQRADDEAWFECPVQPVDAATLNAWWSSRFAPADAELTPLLTGPLENFNRLLLNDPTI